MELGIQRPIFDQEVLLHELNHRIANEFTAVIGSLSVAASRSSNEEVKVELAQATDLLRRYANLHRALQMPQHERVVDASAYLRQLCTLIGRSKLECRDIKLVLAAEPLRLRADACWRLGMIVSELITNATRHAFAHRGGEIRVELMSTGASVTCRVLDDGNAPVNIHLGEGLRVVGELAKSLGGEIEQRFGPRGSVSILVFPCEEDAGIAAQPGAATVPGGRS